MYIYMSVLCITFMGGGTAPPLHSCRATCAPASVRQLALGFELRPCPTMTLANLIPTT